MDHAHGAPRGADGVRHSRLHRQGKKVPGRAVVAAAFDGMDVDEPAV